MEYVDIFTDKYQYKGTASKKEAHRLGLWHRVFTCIAVNKKNGTVILQKKYPNRYDFERKDYLEITVGGHYIAGEKIEDGIREVEEETGEKVKYDQLIPLGIRQTAATITENYIANEFQHIFLLPIEKELEEYNLSGDEVRGLVEIKIDDGIKLLLGETKELEAKGIFNVDNKIEIEKLTITLDDFVKAYLELDELYLRLFIAAKRYIEGEDLKILRW
ncbi:MAG: hypothetical protein A2Y24_01300 [Clostridiales bacterium GWE2_32_10]|nr:MAG: hypothetical protein A2Y24_01300 [Clostridiales bacterium GWE2_32_10]HBY20642.1 NUDIX hydrolase [Clostridiales bacterium]